jgi:hypothetical protein
MKEPRASELIIEELHDLNNLIADSKQLLLKHPDDKLLELAVRQDELRRKLLLKELHLSLSLYLYHTV